MTMKKDLHLASNVEELVEMFNNVHELVKNKSTVQ